MTSVAYQKRVLALAGIFQAVHLVASVARTGMLSQDTMDASLRSIFVTNPDSIAEVWNGTSGVRTGLRLASEIIVRFNISEHADVLRYMLAVIGLERKLAARPEMLRELGARIAAIDERRMQQGDGSRELDEAVVAELADVYEQTLSQIEPRIKIAGQRSYLANTTNINRIRALLLAAVRAAVLYSQVGGRRWQLLLARKPMSEALKSYS